MAESFTLSKNQKLTKNKTVINSIEKRFLLSVDGFIELARGREQDRAGVWKRGAEKDGTAEVRGECSPSKPVGLSNHF